MKILVWGGAGYIGSHTVLGLLENGHEVVIADDSAAGNRNILPHNAAYYKGDCRDRMSLSAFLKKEKVDAVIYCATLSPLEQRDDNPLKYYENHISDIKILLDVLFENGVNKVVFSAVVSAEKGAENITILEEDTGCSENPYCKTKLAMEKMLVLSSQIYGIHYIILRHINIHGEDIDGTIGELRSAEKQLYEMAEDNCKSDTAYGTVCSASGEQNGSEHIDAADIARIHIMAAEYLLNGGRSNIIDFRSGTECSAR